MTTQTEQVAAAEATPIYAVLVNRIDLQRSLSVFLRWFNPEQYKARALAWTEGGRIHFRIGDVGTSIEASGSWPAIVSFAAGALLSVAESPPHESPVRLILTPERLIIGTLSLRHQTVRSLDDVPCFREMPLGADFVEKAWVVANATEEETEFSGLSDVRSAIEDSLEIVAQSIVDSARHREEEVAYLSLEELGVTQESLVAMMLNHLGKRTPDRLVARQGQLPL